MLSMLSMSSMSPNALLFLAEYAPAFLESPYKPFLMFIPFIPWGWLVSTHLDKDAQYFHLNTAMWNGIHLGAGGLALLVMVFTPIFWIGWPVGILILAAPILVYWRVRNAAVPEGQQFSLSGEGLSSRLDARKAARAARDAVLQFVDANGATRPVPSKDDPGFMVHMVAEDLIGPALEGRAGSLDMQIGQSGGQVVQTVDGVRYKREAIPADSGLRVIRHIKEIAGMDVEDQRRRQIGRFEVRGPRGKTTVDAETQGSSSTQRIRLFFDRAKQISKPVDTLGLLPSQLEAVRTVEPESERHGIILVGSPPGFGLTTTMYSLLGRHDAYTSNIKTLEREIELELDGVDHVQFDPSDPDVDFAAHLQSMLRRDPDVVMLDFIQDSATALTAIDPGMDGPLIYIPQRQASIRGQIQEWVKHVGDLKKATKSLRLVMNQRLLRKLCQNCRMAYTPTPEQLRKLNLPAGKVTQLFKAGGKVQIKNKIENCPVCNGSGYLGQTGIFEVMLVDDKIRRMLADNDLKGALAHARREKMIYLQEAALSKVVAGETTIEEIVRIAPKQEAKKKSA